MVSNPHHGPRLEIIAVLLELPELSAPQALIAMNNSPSQALPPGVLSAANNSEDDSGSEMKVERE